MFEHAPTGTFVTRRSFMEYVGAGLYGTALASLLSHDAFGGSPGTSESAEAMPGAPRPTYDTSLRRTQFEPKAKAVIHLFMNGGPSQMDLFDPKPELDRNHGKSYFEKIA